MFKVAFLVCWFASYKVGLDWIDSQGVYFYVNTPDKVYGYVINNEELYLNSVYTRTNISNGKVTRDPILNTDQPPYQYDKVKR